MKMYTHITFCAMVLVALTSACKKRAQKRVIQAKEIGQVVHAAATIAPIITYLTSDKDKLNSILQMNIDSIVFPGGLDLVSGDTSVISHEPIVLNWGYSGGATLMDGWSVDGGGTLSLSSYFGGAGMAVLTLEDYSIGYSTISGTLSLSQTGSQQTSVILSDFVIDNVGDEFQYNGTLTFSRISGGGTSGPFDDVYLLTGAGEFLDSRGRRYDVVFQDLKKTMDCQWIKSGITELINDKNESGILDFGDDSCDNNATLTYGSNDNNVEL